MMTYNFALIGAAGFVAPRHIKAIRDTGNNLIAATDPHDAVGVLDRHFLDVRYFPEIERFDRHLEKLRRGVFEKRVHYVTICSPNYLHDAHVRLALRLGAHAICEKPLVIKPWNLDYLKQLEEEFGMQVNTILQLRVHPSLVALKAALDAEPASTRHQVVLTYVTGRGAWYDVSWKGVEERSGGIAMNIGVHFFDMLLWLFGNPGRVDVHLKDKRRMSGYLELEKADVRWFLSLDFADLPTPPGEAMPRSAPVTPAQSTVLNRSAPDTQVQSTVLNTTHRSITMDGEDLDFTTGFTDLHTRVYEKTLAGEGFGIDDAKPSIELVQRIREADLSTDNSVAHSMLKDSK